MNPQMQNFGGRYQGHPARPAAGGRRPGGVPHGQQAQANVQAQLQQEQMRQRNAQLEHQMAQRRAFKPTDLDMPEGLEELVIGDGVQQYKRLREAEKKLDATMARKILEYQDRVSVHVKHEKTVRISIGHTVTGQHWQQDPNKPLSFDTMETPQFRLSINAQVLEDPDDDIFDETDSEDEGAPEPEAGDAAGESQGTKKDQKKPHWQMPKRHFAFYFKRMNVEFYNPEAPPNDPNYRIEWSRGEDDEIDVLNAVRRGDSDMHVYICLHRDENPERYTLSKQLRDVVLEDEADRADCVMKFWWYVKTQGLIDDDDRRLIHCDDNLRALFNADTVLFSDVPDLILPHLHPLEPYRLPYSIRFDKEFHDRQDEQGTIWTTYDVKVNGEDPIRARILDFINSPETQSRNRHLQGLNDQIAVIIQAIHHHKARSEFFNSLAKDPAGFVDKWNASQKRDLAIILGEPEKGAMPGMEFATGGDDSVWNNDAVREAIRHHLARQDAEKAAKMQQMQQMQK